MATLIKLFKREKRRFFTVNEIKLIDTSILNNIAIHVFATWNELRNSSKFRLFRFFGYFAVL